MVRFRTVGDMSLHRGRRIERRHRRRDRRRDRRVPDHRAGRDARRRPVLRGGDGGPEARGVLLVELLRLATAGSVDDGKSTLIGRLLYDSKQIFEDQLEAVERTSRERGRRVHRPRAAHRRAAGRAGAGHHDRRGVPVLRDAEAEVHHRRHARPHSVHAQHGDGRVHGRPGADPGRRAQGHPRAVEAPRVHRVAAADPAPRAVREQDGPGRLRPSPCSTRSRRSSPTGRAGSTSRT